jgi:uncharacterized protein (DUF1684 family)
MSPDPAPELLALLDWRRRISDLYARIRSDPDQPGAWRAWRDLRDELFAKHPQSPLERSQRAGFSGLAYFDYDPAARVLAVVEPSEPAAVDVPMSQEPAYRFTRFGRATFELQGQRCSLGVYWLEGYGGGLFVSFTDATSGDATYGAGRYLLDTVKGADLGREGDRLVLDFNFAYHPSCAYDPRWACPLAPAENRLPLAVRAGERLAGAVRR